MAVNGSGRTSKIWQRVAGFFRRRTTRLQFVDPRAHSWAREVKSFSELPSQYRPFFEVRSGGVHTALPYSVLTPTFRGGYGSTEPERLLCLLEGNVHVLESTAGRLRCTCYSHEHIDMIEYGVLLLQSWMTIHGGVDDGTVQSMTIRFNSVSDYLMAPFVDCLRGPSVEGSASALEIQRDKLDYLAESHYKFRTYGRASLRTGDNVRQIIFQPEIRQERLRLLGIRLTRLISPAHLSILSDHELINIRDDPSQRWSKGSPHGAIWIYIPRSKITNVVLGSRDDETQEFSVHLLGGLRIRSLFSSEQTHHLKETIADLSS